MQLTKYFVSYVTINNEFSKSLPIHDNNGWKVFGTSMDIHETLIY